MVARRIVWETWDVPSASPSSPLATPSIPVAGAWVGVPVTVAVAVPSSSVVSMVAMPAVMREGVVMLDSIS
jgi:hypothetical protein